MIKITWHVNGIDLPVVNKVDDYQIPFIDKNDIIEISEDLFDRLESLRNEAFDLIDILNQHYVKQHGEERF